MVKKHLHKISDIMHWHKESIGLFFLGVGLTMFILNIVLFLNVTASFSKEFTLAGYYISIVSSIVIMAYSLFNIYNKE